MRIWQNVPIVGMALRRQDDSQSKGLLPSVSTSLALAATIGIAEAVAHFLASGLLMNAVGISADSPMRTPAENLLVPRAFGAPPIVIVLAAQGPFRGFKDTKTPLYAIVAGNLLNAILMFTFFFGIRGAAIATVISEYVNDVVNFIVKFCQIFFLIEPLISIFRKAPDAAILMWKLNSKVLLVATYIDGRRIIGYRKSGGLPIGRSLAVVFDWHLTVSLLTDALALAGQTLLAGGYSQEDYDQARLVICRVLQIGLGIIFFSSVLKRFLAYSAQTHKSWQLHGPVYCLLLDLSQ
ncbi:hypothetical protein TB2_032513 [Malus domestica]